MRALGPRRVILRDLVLDARIGVYASEQGRSQRIRVNAEFTVPDPSGIGDDDLARVVDYDAVVARIRAVVAAGHVRLVETLTERLAAAVLEDDRILTTRIRVEKLDIYPDSGGVGVEIERARE